MNERKLRRVAEVGHQQSRGENEGDKPERSPDSLARGHQRSGRDSSTSTCNSSDCSLVDALDSSITPALVVQNTSSRLISFGSFSE